jgi:hypothetical protein
VEVVYGPLVDAQEFPHDVDVAIVEGAVSSDEDQEKILEIRERTKILVVIGDCGITSNVPGMRNPIGTERDGARTGFRYFDAAGWALVPDGTNERDVARVRVTTLSAVLASVDSVRRDTADAVLARPGVP